MSSDRFIEGVIDDNPEVEVSGTEYDIILGPGAAYRSKLGGTSLVNYLGEALGAEFGTDIGSTEGLSGGNDD